MGRVFSFSWKPGDHLSLSPVVLGVNNAVLWCLLSCSQRGKTGPRHDSGAGVKLQEAHSWRQVQAKMGTKSEVSVGAGLLDHRGEM